MTENKNFYIKTYGCQMNDRDSQAVAQEMTNAGYNLVNNEGEADILLFNTCSVRDQAERKAMGKIGIVKKILKKKQHLQVGVIGCMAQSKGQEITNKYSHVDIVVGTDQLHKVPALLQQSRQEKKQLISTGISRDVINRLELHPEGQISAQVSIMRGCNEYCTYCIVPFTRGQEKSRTVASILEEVKLLVEKGVVEITFLGQNITAYGIIEQRKNRIYDKEKSPFAELLRETAKIEGIKRIRFTSPHARYFNQDLVNTIKAETKICRSIHFPLQSGSDRILRLMRRRYTAQKYLDWINNLKEKVDNITFTTDLIIGFPSETIEEFEMTRKLCNEIDFDQQFIFRYSQRRNTPAANMPNQIDEETKIERNQILLQDLELRLQKRNQAYLHTEQEILVEGASRRDENHWAGRNTHNKIIIFDPQDNIKRGDIIKVKIDRFTQYVLYGQPVES